MADHEWRAFVMSGTRTGKLATVLPSGRPAVKPVWFVLDGDDVLFTTWNATAAARALRQTPYAALSVDDDRPPFAYVILRGPVSVTEDPDTLLHWAVRIAGRYMGEDRAEEYGRRNGVPGELLLRLIPERVITEVGVAD